MKKAASSLKYDVTVRIDLLKKILFKRLWFIIQFRPRFCKNKILKKYKFNKLEGSFEIKSKATILCHIAFHDGYYRWQYLQEIIKNFKNYESFNVSLVVDTNTYFAKKMIQKMHPDVGVIVHDNLGHPYDLTDAHRTAMEKQIESYDYFLYVEDDILILEHSLLMWVELREVIKDTNLIPGFVRVEENFDDELVLTDFRNSVTLETHSMEIHNQVLLKTPYPYQGCWFYDRKLMKEFLGSNSYKNGPDCWGKREKMAAGMIFEKVPEGFSSRSVVMLDENGSLDRKVFIFHLPCNYGKSKYKKGVTNTGYGTVKIPNAIN